MINAYLTDTIIREIAGDLDEWSEREAPAFQKLKAHIVYKTKLVYNLNGEEVASPIQILLKPNQEVDHKDRIKLDGEDFSHPIINIFKRRHLSVEFKEIYLEPGTGRTE